MKLTVIIPTLGRGNLVDTLLDQLRLQSRLPDNVIVTAADCQGIEQIREAPFPVTYLYGSAGLCAQRNRALERALAQGCDLVTFFDDDFIPGRRYLAEVERAFLRQPGWEVVMGSVCHDGARDDGITVQEGLTLLHDAEAKPMSIQVREHPGAYGCNMSMRTRNIGAARFDERLVLYGWQEDIDFTSQLGRHGAIMYLSTAIGVHLGSKSGRLSGLRLGYSQIANPVYLVRKGTMSLRFALDLMGRNLLANGLKSLRPESYIDRRGRLQGNILALFHLLRGRVEPEFVLRL